MAVLFEQNTELQQEIKILTRALEMQDTDQIPEIEKCKRQVVHLTEEKSGLIARINQLIQTNEELSIRLNAQSEHNLQLQRDVNELLRIREHDQVEIQALEEQLMEQSQTIEKLLPKPKANILIQTQPDPLILNM